MNIDDILYSGLLHQHWQMSNSERLAFMQLLELVQPHTAIEVGTYRGGSLSLLSRHCRKVFSLDIDPAVAVQFSHLANTSFITGDSGQTLPSLLKKMERSGEPLGFVLIDGDHSAHGVQRDLNSIFAYVPSSRVFVICHDSFNPDCRLGMSRSDHGKCRYLAYANLDFIPGTVVQQGGPFDGQLWGGLALFVLDPANTTPAPLLGTASLLHERAAHNLATP